MLTCRLALWLEYGTVQNLHRAVLVRCGAESKSHVARTMVESERAHAGAA